MYLSSTLFHHPSLAFVPVHVFRDRIRLFALVLSNKCPSRYRYKKHGCSLWITDSRTKRILLMGCVAGCVNIASHSRWWVREWRLVCFLTGTIGHFPPSGRRPTVRVGIQMFCILLIEYCFLRRSWRHCVSLDAIYNVLFVCASACPKR